MRKGERGRIPNWAKKQVEEDIKKYGLGLAFHYFIYDCDTTNLKDWEIQMWRAFDRWQRIEKGIELKRYGKNIKEQQNER
jgi:hypothetical protein